MDALLALEFMMLCYFFKDKYDDRREKATCLRHSKKLPPCPIHFRSSVVNSFIGKGATSQNVFSNVVESLGLTHWEELLQSVSNFIFRLIISKQIQGSQRCLKIRKIVRTLKLPIANANHLSIIE